mmetsp:Transcript_24395/g.37056  ORF Transcript_24395/g.37056 Transcript_24395/m.37056 type:complete len:80 (-) Transcript_24395:805-1044(-)
MGDPPCWEICRGYEPPFDAQPSKRGSAGTGTGGVCIGGGAPAAPPPLDPPGKPAVSMAKGDAGGVDIVGAAATGETVAH